VEAVVAAAVAAAFGAFILYATTHPSTRISRAFFWWSIRHGNGPEVSRVTQFFGYVTALFWLGLALVTIFVATTAR